MLHKRNLHVYRGPTANGQPFISVYRVYSVITHKYFDVDIRSVVYYVKYTVYDCIFVRVIRSR
jgi:hypothetical protein